MCIRDRYKGSMVVINALQAKNNALSLKGMFTALKTAAIKASINPIAAGIGLLAAAGVYAYFASKKADDMMSPGGNSGGYGSRTLLGPEGAIALNNKDTVIAGTNLFDKGDDVISKGAGDISMPDNTEPNTPNTPPKHLSLIHI